MLKPVHAYEVGPYAAKAFNNNVPLRGWGPERVEIPGGYALPNLAVQGEWVTAQNLGNGIVVVSSNAGHSASVGGMVADALTDRLIWQHYARYAEMDQHSDEADQLRKDIGLDIIKIDDSMLRARMLDAFDAWQVVLGKLLDGDEDGPDGALYASRDKNLQVRLLRVTCPSTKRKYVHLVPASHNKAASARRWVMNLKPTTPVDVET